MLFVNERDGAIRRTVDAVGGADEVAFDRRFERVYVAARDMTANGISQTGVSGATFTPVLGILDARSGDLIDSIPTGKGAHSVATDADTGDVFVPVPPTATSPGGVRVYARVCGNGDEDADSPRRCGCERHGSDEDERDEEERAVGGGCDRSDPPK